MSLINIYISVTNEEKHLTIDGNLELLSLLLNIIFDEQFDFNIDREPDLTQFKTEK